MAETRTRLIDWTGERCVPWGNEVQGIYEHLHRYHFAASFAEGKRVLDLASGEGYGAAILARRAKTVVALELDPVAAAHSRQTYSAPNLVFTEGSMLDLSAYGEGSFEVVVCLEALEHVSDHGELIAGIARVLVDDGVVVLSTPDRDTYNATLADPNPFHLRELDRSQLLDLVHTQFSHVSLWGQNGIGGSRLALLDGVANDGDTFEKVVVRRGDAWLERPAVSPMFFVAVASRSPLPSRAARSYLVDPEPEALREPERQASLGHASSGVLQSDDAVLRGEDERLNSHPRPGSRLNLYRRVKNKLASLWTGL